MIRTDRELFKGAYGYYLKYRPNIPKEVIEIIIKHFRIKKGDRILDIGCGTGQVALAMRGKYGEMVYLDPSLGMLKLAKQAVKKYETKSIWLNCSAEDLKEMKKLGVFKVATFCRSFHWINQRRILTELKDFISEDGGIVILGDKSFWANDEKWQQVVRDVIRKYLGKDRRAGKGKFKKPKVSWEKLIAKSPFKFVKSYSIPIVRVWNVESIIGCVFSNSFAAPHLFGGKKNENKFKEELRSALLDFNPSGKFKENNTWFIILGSKKQLH